MKISTTTVLSIASTATSFAVNLSMASRVSLSIRFAPCVVWQRQDSEGGGGRHCPSPSMNGNQIWRGSSRSEWRGIERLLLTSCLVRQPLARCASNGASGALRIVNAELGAGVEPEIELREIAVK